MITLSNYDKKTAMRGISQYETTHRQDADFSQLAREHKMVSLPFCFVNRAAALLVQGASQPRRTQAQRSCYIRA
jgi:hypothetical protein